MQGYVDWRHKLEGFKQQGQRLNRTRLFDGGRDCYLHHRMNGKITSLTSWKILQGRRSNTTGEAIPDAGKGTEGLLEIQPVKSASRRGVAVSAKNSVIFGEKQG